MGQLKKNSVKMKGRLGKVWIWRKEFLRELNLATGRYKQYVLESRSEVERDQTQLKQLRAG